MNLLQRRCLIILCLNGGLIYAQDNYLNGYAKKDGLVGGSIQVASFENLKPKFGIGIEGEYLLGNRFGFGFVFSGGPDYLEVGSGILGVLGLMDPSVRLLTLFLIENPNIHFEPSRNSEFVLSLSLCRIRYMYEQDSYYDTDLFASGSIILRYTRYYRIDWNYSFFVEGSTLYHQGRPKGIQAGIALRLADK
jgi:hypothetical protein